ncbi:MAG TPA: hypothetical protein DCS97_00335 [Planctomycetes bacterium]|nr:hypothetical protein [Planctomycetota bacterium]
MLSVASEGETIGDVPMITYNERRGAINADLTIGAAVAKAVALQANAKMSFMGMTLVGEGFRLVSADLSALGISSADLPAVIRPYIKGKDVVQDGELRWVIDFFGLDESDARRLHPVLFQRLHDLVKPERMENKRQAYRDRWWWFGEARAGLRAALAGLPRYIVTVETSKFKPFVFLPAEVIPDHKLYAIASNDAFHLGVLSSRVHLVWALSAGGRMGVGNDPTWTNGTCFDPFPFPACTPAQQVAIRAMGEELDAHRKRQQAAHPGLTLTNLYNVLAKLRSGEALTAKEKTIHEQGLCSVLKDLHDRLDAAVADAYGWPVDLPDDELLARLVALNAERAAEEAAGTIRWLRPDYQIPLLGPRATGPPSPKRRISRTPPRTPA